MRGRPTRSQIRQNIIEILNYLGNAYGYDIYKHYLEIFPKVTQRSIYYHLRKGVDTKEIRIHKVKEEKGDFSWGNSVQKVYYALGEKAYARGLKRVKEYFDNLKKKK